MKLNRAFFSAAVLVPMLAIGLFGGVANAQTPPTTSTDTPRPVSVVGRVDRVSNNALSMTTRRGQVTANVSINTWIIVQRDGGRCVEGTLRDIQTSRPATVAGMTTGQQRVIDARVIVQGRCRMPAARAIDAREKARAAAHFAEGTIKAINGNTLTVTTDRGTEAAVNTTADTVVLGSGFKSVSALKVGDRIEVIGNPVKPAERPANTARAINAWGLRVVTAGSGMVTGQVRSISGNTATVVTQRNRAGVAVTLDNGTAYKSLSRADGKATLVDAALSDVRVGSTLMVEGPITPDGKALTAKAVIILPGGRAQP